MSARSEGDETPLWLDAHACQEARGGGTDAPAGRAGICALCRGGRSERVRGTRECVRRTHEYLHSHSERIVGRGRAFLSNPG